MSYFLFNDHVDAEIGHPKPEINNIYESAFKRTGNS